MQLWIYANDHIQLRDFLALVIRVTNKDAATCTSRKARRYANVGLMARA